MATSLTDNFCRTCVGSTGTSITDHEAAADPHTQYLTQTEGDALYASTGDGAGAVATHEAAGDPHTVYLLSTDAASTYRTSAQVDTAAGAAVTTHVGLADPHTQYLLETAAVSDYRLTADIEDMTGYAEYVDATITSGSPLAVAATTDTVVTNDAATTYEAQIPSDVTEYYDQATSKITGAVLNELLRVQLDMVIDPSGATAFAEVWLDDGTNEIGRQVFSLIKGATPQKLVWAYDIRVSSDLVATGGIPTIRVSTTADVYEPIWTITRVHQAQ